MASAISYGISSRPERRYSKFARRRAQLSAKVATEGEASTSEPIMQGWMNKQGGPLARFMKRWFVLLPDGRLEYYVQPGAKKPKGMIPINECHIGIPDASENRRPHCLIVSRRMMKTYYIFAKSRDEQLNWIRALSAFTEDSAVVGGVQLHQARPTLPAELMTSSYSSTSSHTAGARARGATLVQEASSIGLDLHSTKNMVFYLTKTMQRLDGLKHKAMKDSVQRVTTSLVNKSQSIGAGGDPSFDFAQTTEPLVLACSSGDSKLIELGLNGLDGLLGHSHLHTAPTSLLQDIVHAMSSAGESASDENLQFRVVMTCGAAAAGQSVPGSLLCDVLDILSSLTLHTRNVRVQQAAKGMMRRIVHGVVHQVGEEPLVPLPPMTEALRYKGDSGCEYEFPDRFHHDAFVLFLHVIEQVGQQKNVTLTWLELLSALLEDSGPLFSNAAADAFIDIVRTKLCVALLSHCVSDDDGIFRAALAVLVSLTLVLREHLKVELYVIYTTIILKMMDTAQTPTAKRTVMMEELFPLFGDSQCLVELYLNYDCETECDDVFQKLLQIIAKFAQGAVNIHLSSMEEQMDDMTLREVALEAMTEISASFMRFAADQDNAAPTSTPSHSSSTVTEMCTDVVNECVASVFSEDALDELAERARRKTFKVTLAEAIKKFNYKAEKGIVYFLGQTRMARSPESVSTFLLTPGLDATLVGEYIGGGKDFHVQVLHAFVEQLSFVGMTFDAALRYFLSLFWLPGEGQKIDRIMEQFAMQYVKNNPKAFRSADAAYVLAFSVIMLNTDAHSTHVKKKMTEDEFLRNNRGIDDSGDLPEDFMRQIYHAIVGNEIKMRKDVDMGGDGDGSVPGTLRGTSKKRRLQAEQARQKMVQNLAAAFKDSSVSSRFYRARSPDVVKNMMESVWGTFLTTFSHIFKTEDEEIIAMGLAGFRNSLVTSARFDLTTQIDVFISTLATMLNKDIDVLSRSLVHLLTGEWVLRLPEFVREKVQGLAVAAIKKT